MYVCMYMYVLAEWVECSAVVRKPLVQSQVRHTKDFKNHTLPTCLTLSNVRYVSRVKWSNPWKGVTPCPIPLCSCY